VLEIRRPYFVDLASLDLLLCTGEPFAILATSETVIFRITCNSRCPIARSSGSGGLRNATTRNAECPRDRERLC
jgi:hypothetical protein